MNFLALYERNIQYYKALWILEMYDKKILNAREATFHHKCYILIFHFTST